ncbi:MAG: aminopeptidase [Gammaproteobacteria bacterium]|nr:aminopeptidase [Gammaproteobacteria bacterium]MBT8443757.1 aminopeptidase [Gammaproteobacteria bacterium]
MASLTGVRSVAAAVAILLTTSLIGGCSIGYYWQASMGHLELMRQRRPVADVLDDSGTPEDVRAKLEIAASAVDFAHAELGLPDNGSYRLYADTGRAYVVWNVVAAPEFSLEPRTWCFPVAGCISYRGYFDEENARRFASGLAGDGDDVFVGGVAAYSTLGRFEDPILNTMIGYSDYQLAGLIFHELAHQRIYVKDDSTFNEGFASFVELEGLRRWLGTVGTEQDLCRYDRSLQRRSQVLALLAVHRERLESLYSSDRSPADLRMQKAAVFADLATAYRELREGWAEPPYFDRWFDGALNNARLVALATYDEYVPAFGALLQQSGGRLETFYAAVEALTKLDSDERLRRFDELLDIAAATEPAANCLPVAT